MTDPAEKLDEEQEDKGAMLDDEELKATLRRSVESLHSKANRLRLLAKPLREECTETAKLAHQCKEAVEDI